MGFDEFVRVHGDSLIRLAYVLCGDRGRAEDATQETLTRLYLRWGRIDDPLPYARRCVVNATNDHWRRSGRRERREQLAAQQQWPDAPALVDDQVVDRDRLVQALRRLPHGQRAVIVLRYRHQLPEPVCLLEDGRFRPRDRRDLALCRRIPQRVRSVPR